MKKNVNSWLKVFGLALVAAMCLSLSICGLTAIHADLTSEPLVRNEYNEPIIREVLAWYYEDGTVEDEQGQLWYFEDAAAEGQVWRLWINDSGTPADPTDDIVVDYTGG